jgi:hypothetical protein
VKSPLGWMLVKSSFYGDVIEKPMMGMLYPFPACTLTRVKSIVTMCECRLCHHVLMIHVSRLFLFIW